MQEQTPSHNHPKKLAGPKLIRGGPHPKGTIVLWVVPELQTASVQT